MKSFTNIILGFGKGGKTLAGALAQAGQPTALIEKDAGMQTGSKILLCAQNDNGVVSARSDVWGAVQPGCFSQ